MARIFAYIAHKGGVADDSAAELLAAAKKIDRGRVAGRRSSPVAGAELDAVCETLRGFLRTKCGRSRTRAWLTPMRSWCARR